MDLVDHGHSRTELVMGGNGTDRERSLPCVTVLIPARPDQQEVLACDAALKLDYPPDRLEILVVRGRAPSLQRNVGIREAVGEIIYFLDDDSVPDPGNVRRAIEWFEDSKVAIIGGPSLCPPEAPFWERSFALVTTTWLGFGPSRARYMRVGQARLSSEKELILCNLLARKNALLEVGGFNESLYPNEENVLMDQLRGRGWKMIYDPELFVYRRPRHTLSGFMKMVFRYGRGRAEQFRVHPTSGSLPNLVPPLFCVYLGFVPFVGGILVAPLFAYLLMLAVQFALLLRSARMWESLVATLLVFVTHVIYGMGFWCGIFTRLRKPSAGVVSEVRIERIRSAKTQ